MKLKEQLENDKPREKLALVGVSYLTESELLSILLRTGSKNESVNELSTRILKEVGNINNLSQMSLTRLLKIKGVKLSKASTILATFELGKRVYKEKNKKIKLNNSTNIFNYFKNEFINIKQESFYILLYDTKMNLILKKEIYKGTIDSVTIHPREIFKEAIKESASFIIIMHNHPSGDTTPSKEDIEITNRLIQVGQIVGIKVLDHIIISNESYYSFYENSINPK